MPNPFSLKTPCKSCPFRSDVDPYLRPERAREIAQTLRDGADFPCHKTVLHEHDDQGDEYAVRTAKTQFCAGALITMENEGYSNQQVRIAERLGIYDPDRLDMSAPVHPSLSAWVRSYSPVQKTTGEDDQVACPSCAGEEDE